MNRLSSSASEGSDSDPKKTKTSKGLRKGARTQMLDFQRAGTVEMEEKQAELHAAVGGTEEMMRRHNLEIPRGHDELVNGHVVRRTSTEYDWQDLTPTALKKRQELAESVLVLVDSSSINESFGDGGLVYGSQRKSMDHCDRSHLLRFLKRKR